MFQSLIILVFKKSRCVFLSIRENSDYLVFIFVFIVEDKTV